MLLTESTQVSTFNDVAEWWVLLAESFELVTPHRLATIFLKQWVVSQGGLVGGRALDEASENPAKVYFDWQASRKIARRAASLADAEGANVTRQCGEFVPSGHHAGNALALHYPMLVKRTLGSPRRQRNELHVSRRTLSSWGLLPDVTDALQKNHGSTQRKLSRPVHSRRSECLKAAAHR